MQDNRAGKNGKNGFKTHEKGSDARFCPFLRNGLKSVSCAAGKRAGINNRKPRPENILNIRFFKNEHHDNGNCSANKELKAGKLYAVNFRSKMSDCKNMYGISKRAYENGKIPFAYRKAFVHAKKIKSGNGNRAARPDHFRKFLFKQKSEEGNNKNIENGNKTCFSDCGLGNSYLLDC